MVNLIDNLYKLKFQVVKMKLYGVSDGPPSLAVRMTLTALEIPFELKPVDFIAAEHMTEEYAKVLFIYSISLHDVT